MLLVFVLWIPEKNDFIAWKISLLYLENVFSAPSLLEMRMIGGIYL